VELYNQPPTRLYDVRTVNFTVTFTTVKDTNGCCVCTSFCQCSFKLSLYRNSFREVPELARPVITLLDPNNAEPVMETPGTALNISYIVSFSVLNGTTFSHEQVTGHVKYIANLVRLFLKTFTNTFVARLCNHTVIRTTESPSVRFVNHKQWS
jgi:hypothetical protein